MKPSAVTYCSFLILFSCICITQATALAQPPADTTSHSLFTRYTPVILQLGEGSSFGANRLDGLFSRFEVIDLRPDTARIGIHAGRYKSAGSFNRQMVFSRPVAAEIASYLNQHFARQGAPYTGLVVLRTLWLSDVSYIREELMKAPEKRFEKTRIRLKAEVYAARDSVYIPVFRFDSLQTSTKGSYTRFSKDLTGILDQLADSSSVVIAGRRESGRVISFDEIRAFNQSRFDMAICKDSLLRKGVYASFEEFRNNTPSILDYEIKKEEENILIYIKETGGRSYYSHSAWGYCDGKNIFIMKDGVLRPAWREGKAWYFFGKTRSEANDAPADNTRMTSPSQVSAGPGPSGTTVSSGDLIASLAHSLISSAANEKTRLRIFAVDMDNGTVY